MITRSDLGHSVIVISCHYPHHQRFLAWALQVDGFRFDIMSCLMVSTMEKARDALRALTLEQHGVDGSSMLLYGEGWDFGEVIRIPHKMLCYFPQAFQH